MLLIPFVGAYMVSRAMVVSCMYPMTFMMQAMNPAKTEKVEK